MNRGVGPMGSGARGDLAIKITAIFVCLGMIGCSPSHSGSSAKLSENEGVDERGGETSRLGSRFRGYYVTNQMVVERFLKTGESFELGSYLGVSDDRSNIFSSGSSILDLLGRYDSEGYSSRFKNGEPNALNMLLWYILLEKFSQQIGDVCKGSSDMPLSEQIQGILQVLCQWPSLDQDGEILTRYWLLIMGFDAPLEEMSVWKEMALTPESSQWSPSDAVAHLTLAILYNPYFLLRH